MTGTHLRITWHVAYDPDYWAPSTALALAAECARRNAFPVTITHGTGVVAPWPDEPCLTITSYVPADRDPADAGRFARVLATAFRQESVVWTEEPVTLNTTERNPS